jgi:hypothetical protein
MSQKVPPPPFFRKCSDLQNRGVQKRGARGRSAVLWVVSVPPRAWRYRFVCIASYSCHARNAMHISRGRSVQSTWKTVNVSSRSRKYYSNVRRLPSQIRMMPTTVLTRQNSFGQPLTEEDALTNLLDSGTKDSLFAALCIELLKARGEVIPQDGGGAVRAVYKAVVAARSALDPERYDKLVDKTLLHLEFDTALIVRSRPTTAHPLPLPPTAPSVLCIYRRSSTGC